MLIYPETHLGLRYPQNVVEIYGERVKQFRNQKKRNNPDIYSGKSL